MSPLSIRFLRPRRIPPPIVLLTDFGLSDQYAGVMKGVIASMNPRVGVIDLSHDIKPQNIRQASYVLWASYRYFPPGTVFVCVVDPGVGSDRKILGVRTPQGVFLSPDNGLLDLVLWDERALETVEVIARNSPFFPATISATFHGRDVFAPVAAHLSLGGGLDRVGKPTELPPVGNPFVEEQGATNGAILHIDRFGNIITNVRLNNAAGVVKALSVGRTRVSQWIKTYEEAPAKRPCLITGSSGLIEIVVKNGNAAQGLGIRGQVPVKVHWR